MADKEFSLFLSDGDRTIEMLVPANFYELPRDCQFSHYIEPALAHLQLERDAAKAALN